MDFSSALKELKEGYILSRADWNGPGQWIEVRKTDEHSDMTAPYIYICTIDGDLVPWVPTQGDLFANDWVRITVN